MKAPLVDIVCEYVSPLVLAVEDRHQLKAFLDDIGFHVELSDAQAEAIGNLLDISKSTESLTALAEALAAGSVSPGSATEQAFRLAESLRSALNGLLNVSPSAVAALPAPLNDTQQWKDLGLKVPGYLLLRWLQVNRAFIYETLYFLDIVTESPARDGDDLEREIHWDRLGQFLLDPEKTLTDQYKWGSKFEHQLFITKLRRLLASFSLPAVTIPVGAPIIDEFFAGKDPGDISELVVNLLTAQARRSLPQFAEPRLGLAPTAEGLLLNAALIGDLPQSCDLNDEWTIDFESIASALEQTIGLEITPAKLRLTVPLSEGSARLVIRGQPESPWILFGNPTGARLELAGLEAGFEIKGTPSKPELGFSMATSGGDPQSLKLVINPADGDGFISYVLGGKELSFSADVGIAWSSETGVQFQGGAGLEIVVPLNIAVGPVTVDQLRLALSAGTDGARLEAAVTGGVDISVLVAVVDDVGVRARVAPLPKGDNSGLLGPLDLKLEFKPPNGMGLVIDGGGIVTGGGYLAHDEDKFQYAGVGEVGFVSLGLSAIGILNTKLPDGSEGWSLFLSIFSEFPPLQLGFGFTLNGVGGLVGIHRTLDEEALRERLVAGAMDSIMFPEDPVANAPRIISDIEAVFPPAVDQFIFGAMMKIGWGTPALVTVDLGVIVELPDPIRIALLGQLEALLPTPDVRILELHMDVFGLADITAGTLSIDATLRDSSIIKLLTLSGDMAMRADFLDNPTMLMSIGGFNPRFKAPAEFPDLRFMKASLPLGDLARVDVMTYVAFTSNTFQIGGRLDIWAKFAGFTAEGYLEMDALIEYSPFGFDFHTGFGVTVKAGSITLMGVDVTADLSGPSPWDIKGKATFEILKLKKRIDLDISVGQRKNDAPEPVVVEELLVKNLQNPDNWTVVSNDDCFGFIQLRERLPEEGEAVHPGSSIQFIQKIVPLNASIETFGGVQVSGQSRFEIEAVRVGVSERAAAGDEYIQDWFAPAQFFKMSDAEKISAPSFERMDGGIQFASDSVRSGNSTELTVEYEEIVHDTALNQRRTSQKRGASLPPDQMSKFKGSDSAARARNGNPRFAQRRIAPQFTIADRTFKILNQETGEPLQTKTSTYAEAQTAARRKSLEGLNAIRSFQAVASEEIKQ